eukprot:3514049-Prymnesium_polylepis.1
MAAAAGRARQWPSRRLGPLKAACAAASGSSSRDVASLYLPFGKLGISPCSRNSYAPSLGRDCAFARRQKGLLAKQQRMMILGDFL